MFFSLKKGLKLDLSGSLEPVLNDLKPLLEAEFKKKYRKGLQNGLVIGALVGFVLGAVLVAQSSQSGKTANFSN